MVEIDGADGLRDAVGHELGVSDWLLITQERIDAFAEATGDRQWIHVDPDAARDSHFGSTIAHGYLTLALLPPLMADIFTVKGRTMAMNYGLGRVRFPAPVPVDSRIRLRLAVLSADDVDGGGVQVTLSATVEREAHDRPVCVAEPIVRYLF